MRLDGFSVEELAAAMLREEGWRVDIADPVTNHEWDGSERKVIPKRDFFGEFDLLCLRPCFTVKLIQVTRDGQDAVSEKQVSIVERAPWPAVDVELWHWDGASFAVWRLTKTERGYEWEEWNLLRPQEEPKALINRHDTSLG